MPSNDLALKSYRLSRISLFIFIALSIAWLILSGVGTGGGASFALLYPFAGFALASLFNIFPLSLALDNSFRQENPIIARKAAWLCIVSGITPAICIAITMGSDFRIDKPLCIIAIGIFCIYSLIAIVFQIAVKNKG